MFNNLKYYIESFPLLSLILTPLIFIVFLLIFQYIKKFNFNIKDWMQQITMLGLLLTFAISIYIWILFDKSYENYQFVQQFTLWIPFTLNFYLGLDGFSFFFIILITFLCPLCIIWSWDIYKNKLFFFVSFLFITFGLLITFLVLDFFLFFFFFECLLIPMFLLIGILGGRFRRAKAAYFLAFYTILGSILLLFGIILLWLEFGSTNLITLEYLDLPYKKQVFIWCLLFFGFAVKIPLFPLHLWLPEAHVEAPTIGSVILAAFLLKIGGYGIIRWVFMLFPFATFYMLPIINMFSILGVIYCALTAMRQIDIKRIIAYSSVSHMNLGVLGSISFNMQGLEGFVFLMLGHGLVSTSLFLLVGSLYDRFHTKLIYYFGGLCQIMPIFSIFFFFFNIANFSFPGTSNFIGELLLLVGIVKSNVFIFLLSGFGILFGTCFSILLLNKVIFGTLKLKKTRLMTISLDLTRRETFVLTVITIYTILIGFYPSIILDNTYSSLKFILTKMLI